MDESLLVTGRLREYWQDFVGLVEAALASVG
jgi:hypothetical protein